MSAEKVELKTRRLLLRPFRLEDVDDVFEYASDAEYARFLDVPQPYTRKAAEESVARHVLSSWEAHPTWAIVLNQRVVGRIGLRTDVRHEIGELGYSLSREHWGRGLATEAAEAVTDWGFEERRLAKIFAYADALNKGSLRVMEKLHMRREAVLRSHSKERGERIDDVYSMACFARSGHSRSEREHPEHTFGGRW